MLNAKCHAIVRKQVLKVDVDDHDDGEHDCDLALGIESTIFYIAHHGNKLLMGEYIE